MQESEIYYVENIGLRPKQPGDRIDVYLRSLVHDLKILWNHGMKEVWDEFKLEEFTMRAMPSTTTRLITTSLARVKEKVQLAHTAWKILMQCG
jgi:hypothetical protein